MQRGSHTAWQSECSKRLTLHHVIHLTILSIILDSLSRPWVALGTKALYWSVVLGWLGLRTFPMSMKFPTQWVLVASKTYFTLRRWKVSSTFLNSLAARKTQLFSYVRRWGVCRVKEMIHLWSLLLHHIPGILNPRIPDQTVSSHFLAFSFPGPSFSRWASVPACTPEPQEVEKWLFLVYEAAWSGGWVRVEKERAGSQAGSPYSIKFLWSWSSRVFWGYIYQDRILELF
jgi:hypothetical protein